MSMARFARASCLALAAFAAVALSLFLFAASPTWADASDSGGVDVICADVACSTNQS